MYRGGSARSQVRSFMKTATRACAARDAGPSPAVLGNALVLDVAPRAQGRTELRVEEVGEVGVPEGKRIGRPGALEAARLGVRLAEAVAAADEGHELLQ